MGRPEAEPHKRIEQDHAPEKCGISGIFSKDKSPVSDRIPKMQATIQGRGHDTAGMAAFSYLFNEIVVHSDSGKVKDVFPDDFDFWGNNLVSDVAIGHNRYATSGEANKDDLAGAQPVIASYGGRSIAVAFNGNIPDRDREILQSRIKDDMPKQPDIDTYDIAGAIACADGDDWKEKIKKGLQGVPGAYSLTMLTDQGELFALRGPTGVWPLWMKEDEKTIQFGSETVVDDPASEKWKEAEPGVLYQATRQGIVSERLFEPPDQTRICSLDSSYMERGESQIAEGLAHQRFRVDVGRRHARENPVEADVYIPIPNSGRAFAFGYAQEMGVPLTDFFQVKDPTRTFQGKDQNKRHALLNGKFEIPDPSLVEGKVVWAGDDSSIRGTSHGGYPLKPLDREDLEQEQPQDGIEHARGVVQQLRDAGAKEVHLGVEMPMVTDGCDQGVFLKKEQLLSRHKRKDGSYEVLTEEDMAVRVGADSIHFTSPQTWQEAHRDTRGHEACMDCMGGKHPSDIYREKVLASSGEVTVFQGQPVPQLTTV